MRTIFGASSAVNFRTLLNEWDVISFNTRNSVRTSKLYNNVKYFQTVKYVRPLMSVSSPISCMTFVYCRYAY